MFFNSLRYIEVSFPRASSYRNGHTVSSVQEPLEPFRHFPYRERHIQCLWANPRLRPEKLQTSEGEPIVVEQPGDWNLEAGPDFLNAVLLVGKEKRRVSGDLEIHIHPNGWKQHGHGNDPNFSGVRFHIVYFQGLEIPGLIQVPLQETLATDPRFSFDNIDLTAYPYSIPIGNFPLKGMDPDRKTDWLESAGEERLHLKAERLALAMQSKDPEQILWEELLSSLGYKNNKTICRKLAGILPLTRAQSLAQNPDEAYALLLGLSGLLPINPNPEWDTDTRKFIRTLWDFWWKQTVELQECALEKSEWNLAGIRPTNHPVRRLMAAAHYLFNLQALTEDPTNLIELPTNHWNTHMSWKSKCKPTALVGQARANAIITNILTPYQAATGATELNLKNLPAEPSNSIIRQTAHTLFGPDHTAKVYKSALARQGLIQVFHDYVITHRLEELKAKIGGIASPRSTEDKNPEHSTDVGDIVPPHPNRQHPAHHPPIERHNNSPIIFLTVCTHKRKCILANPHMHDALVNAWKAANHWVTGRYVIMPDHIHLFCSPTSHEAVGIAQWTAYWKRLVSQQSTAHQPLWQRDCWDTQLRNHESYSEKWTYVRNNPVRAGLVKTSDDWPYQGSLNHLPW
jgi:putative transposase